MCRTLYHYFEGFGIIRGKRSLCSGRKPKAWPSEVTSSLVPDCVFCIQISVIAGHVPVGTEELPYPVFLAPMRWNPGAKCILTPSSCFCHILSLKYLKKPDTSLIISYNELDYVGKTRFPYTLHEYLTYTLLRVSDHQCHLNDFHNVSPLLLLLFIL